MNQKKTLESKTNENQAAEEINETPNVIHLDDYLSVNT